MPDTFTFKKTNPMVVRYLTQPEIATITTEQASDAYVFEFHEGHDTGNPIYVRPDGNKDKSNLPKFDTKNKTASDYRTVGSLANGGKLETALKTRDKTDLINVIQNNWALLSKIASGYWGR